VITIPESVITIPGMGDRNPGIGDHLRPESMITIPWNTQELLGHAAIDSTIRYTRVEVSDLAKVIARSHPREREWTRKSSQRG